MTETVVNKLRLKNIIDKAWDEILNPEYRGIEKKIALSLAILIISVLGVEYSIGLIVYGIDTLLKSGISKILIQRAVGFSFCIIGVIVPMILLYDARGALRRVLWEKKPEVKSE